MIGDQRVRRASCRKHSSPLFSVRLATCQCGCTGLCQRKRTSFEAKDAFTLADMAMTNEAVRRRNSVGSRDVPEAGPELVRTTKQLDCEIRSGTALQAKSTRLRRLEIAATTWCAPES